jgi:nucleoside-diphosphate-sugar epimerase
VVRELSAAGHDVLGCDITSDSLRGDLTDPDAAHSIVEAAMPRVIVHLAAWSDAGIVGDARTYGDNVRSTFNILQAALVCGAESAIIASSAQVYGLSRKPPDYAPIDEWHPVSPRNSYAASKLACESAGEYFSSAHGLRVLAFRIMGARIQGKWRKNCSPPRPPL